MKPSCGCTTAALAKNDVAPGEKGEITATFKIGDRTGLQVKTITVETDDPKAPQTVLTFKATIAQMLEVQPNFVFWQANEPAQPKTIIAKAGKGVTIKKVDVVLFERRFHRESGAGLERRANSRSRSSRKTRPSRSTPVLRSSPT